MSGSPGRASSSDDGKATPIAEGPQDHTPPKWRVPFAMTDVFGVFGARPRIYAHVLTTPAFVFAPVGAGIGAILSAAGGTCAPMLVAAGTGSVVANICGGAAGALALARVEMKGEDNRPTPWNAEMIADREKRLKVNAITRTLDVAAWLGAGTAGALKASGALDSLKLSAGVLGIAQASSLGGVAGTLLAACVIVVLNKGSTPGASAESTYK